MCSVLSSPAPRKSHRCFIDLSRRSLGSGGYSYGSDGHYHGYQRQQYRRVSFRHPPQDHAQVDGFGDAQDRGVCDHDQSTQPKTVVRPGTGASPERAVLVPVGASLLVRDNLVSTVKGFATKYSTRAGFERELKRYERRGTTARNRFERQVRKTRTRFERELRQRRTRVERTVKQNRRRFEREVRSVRRDLEKQSGQLSTRVEKLVSDAQELITSASKLPSRFQRPARRVESAPRDRFAGLITSPANAVPLLSSTAGASYESGAPSAL